MQSNVKLKNAIKLALLSTGAAAASTAVAQQEETQIEEIVVTGTRIQRFDLDAVSPVTSVSAREFELSGNINIEQKLAELPNTIPSFGPSSNNPGNGTALVDLRGLGTERTLVLVNGRRWIQSSQFGTVDLNTIPGTLIERVDVLTGGSSAVYGSDALAGVVNFQLKQDFEGVEITGLYDVTDEGDAEKYNVDITIGGNFAGDKGNAVIYAGFADREPLFQGDRAFSNVAFTESTDANGNPILVPGGSSGIPGTNVFGGPTIDPDGVPDSGDEFPLGRFEPDGTAVPFIDPQDRFNYAPDNFLQLPQERYIVMGFAHYDITDSAQVYGELVSTNNKVDQELAPTPAFAGTIEVNPDSPFFDAPTQAALDGIREDTNGDGVIDDNDNAFLPFIGRRMVENGPRQALNQRSGIRGLAGVRGDFTDTWGYDAYFSFSRLETTELLNNDVAETLFRQALLVNDTGTACQDPSGGCVPLNIFGAGNISQAAVGFVNIGATNITSIDQDVYNFTITGELGSISDAAGPIMLAAGLERREDESAFRPDTFLSTGDVLGFNAGEATIGDFDVNEIFGEIDIPLVAGLPGARELGVWLAGRFSDYSNIGEVESFAGAVRWSPIEQLRFRAGFQRAVRAPNVGELFAGQAQGFPGAVDPCSAAGTAGQPNPSQTLIDLCVQSGVAPDQVGNFTQANIQIEGLFGGNPDLKEEESDTFTLGFVVEPIDGLDFTVDYFNIEIEDAIDILGGSVGGVLDVCFNDIQDPSSPFCQAIVGPGGQPFTRRTDGNVDVVEVLNENIAALETSGIDFNVNYVTDFNAGLFDGGSSLAVDFRSTFMDTFEITPVVGLDTVFECAGNFGQSACNDAFPEFQANTRITWETGPLGLSVLWRYIQGPEDETIENEGVDPATLAVPEIDDANYVDFTVSYTFEDNIDVNLGFRNIFDEEVTLLGDQQEQANTFPETYDVFGPRAFLSVSYTWQ